MTDEIEAPSAPASAPRYLAADEVGLVTSQDFVYPRAFTFKNGQQLSGLALRYETYGTLNATRDNAVLICHALSGNHHAAGWNSPADKKPGWWNNLIGPGKAVDTRRFFVICANVPGGCSGSTGPSSPNPATGEPYGLRFPALTILDMVRAQKLLLDHLGVAELHTVIGGSMGGMTAMLFAIEFPRFTRRLLAMATTAREGAQAIAFNEVGRQAIMQDPAWLNGDYPRDGGPRVGLAIARMMAHITYLSDASMERKFGRRTIQSRAQSPQLHSELPASGAPPSDSPLSTLNSQPSAAAADFNIQFEVESYLRHQGQTFINRFDANSYLYITRALDQFDLDHAYGSLEQAFAPVQAESLVVGFTSDWLFPPEQNRAIALALLRAGKRASYAELATDLGHDSFLLESEELYALVRGFLERDQPYASDFAI
ncbi:MAG: homoserine O-acetyltransferase [Undibacterium sp.]|nr:homoserine O-acetyltransferase [Opitutaceae bacterium]